MEQYKFSSDDGKLWTRKLHGSEIVMANASETLDGWGLFGIGVNLSLASPAENLKECVSTAWARLRHAIPAVAALSFRGDHGDMFEYRVPANGDDLRQWLEHTIKWHDDEKSLIDRHTESKLYTWKISDRHYSKELHASILGSNGIQILIHGQHWTVDARYLFALMDLYLRFLKSEILKEAAPLEEPTLWGEETTRLPPAAAVASGIFGQQFPPPPQFPTMFVRPSKGVDMTPSVADYTARISFTFEESIQFRNACKIHGKTATQVLGTLLALSEIKTTLWLAKNQPAKYAEAAKLYQTADVIPVALTINARDKLQKEYTSLTSANATPGMVVDSIPPVMLDLNVVRNAFAAEEDGVIFKDSNPNAFWDEIVPAFVSAWSAIPADVTSFVSREEFFTAHPEVLTFDKPLIVCSSVGDIDRLGLIGKNSFSPAFVVDELNSSVRFSSPLTGLLAWQWDGRMELRLASGAKTTEKSVLERQASFYMEILRLVCA